MTGLSQDSETVLAVTGSFTVRFSTALETVGGSTIFRRHKKGTEFVHLIHKENIPTRGK